MLGIQFGGEIMNVKLARIKKRLTQDELCKIVRIGKKQLVEAEKGNYDNLKFKSMKKIANALDSTVEELFFCEV